MKGVYHETKATIFNPILPNISLAYHLKTSENQWFFDVFRVNEMKTLRRNGLNTYN